MDLAELIESNKAAITRELNSQVAAKVAESLSWTLGHEVQKCAETYIKENVLPDVMAQLKTQHNDLVVGIVAAVKTGLDSLSAELTKKIVANASSSWKLADIAKKLLD